MLEILIKEYEDVLNLIDKADDENMAWINYLDGMKQGIAISMSAIDFKGACEYFEGDDLPF